MCRFVSDSNRHGDLANQKWMIPARQPGIFSPTNNDIWQRKVEQHIVLFVQAMVLPEGVVFNDSLPSGLIESMGCNGLHGLHSQLKIFEGVSTIPSHIKYI